MNKTCKVFVMLLSALTVMATTAYVLVHTLLQGHSGTLNCLAFSSSGLYLASGSEDRTVVIWNSKNGDLLYRIVFDEAVDSLLWHPLYTDTIIVGLADGYVCQINGMLMVRPLASHPFTSTFQSRFSRRDIMLCMISS